MPYTGLTARLTINDKKVAYISNWSVDETRDTIEITQLGKKEKEIKPSLHYWSASAEGTADFATESAQKEIRDAMLSDTPVDVKFYLDVDNNVALYGKAYVTSFSVNISAEDKGGVSISLTGTGELTYSSAGSISGQNI